MNYSSSATLIGWETRSVKRYNKAVDYCKDYGLKPVLKSLYIGKLYAKERKSILLKLRKVLNKKTDKIFLGTFCESCFGGLDSSIKEHVPVLPAFKIIK